MALRPIPFFPGAATWRPAGAPPEAIVQASSPHETLESHFEDLRFDASTGVAMDEPTSQPLFDVKALQQEVEPVSSPHALGTKAFHVAPLWRRAAAALVDALPIAGAAMLCLLAYEKRLEAGHAPLVPHSLDDLARMYWSLDLGNLVLAAVIVLAVVLYQTFCLGFMHATVGDLVCGLRWVTKDGSPPRPLRAFVRVLLLLPSWLLAGAGVWMFLLSRTRRAFYDIASGCYLVMRE